MFAEPQTVLLTGASSGIGLALARKLATLPQHYRLVVTARDESFVRMMSMVRGENVIHRKLNLHDAEGCQQLMEDMARDFGGVDILINNAGISYRTVVEHLGDDDEQRQMDTNFFAPLRLMRLALPGMRQKHAGRIINVSSVGGMMAMPTMGIYSASKFALEGISESLWYEMRPWGVHVSLVQPGFVRSDSYRRVLFSETAARVIEGKEAYYNYYLHMGRFIESLMMRARTTPENIAERILRIMEQRNPPLRVPIGMDAHFFALLRRWLPRSCYHRLLYAFLPGIRRWGTGWRAQEPSSSP